MSKIKPAPLPPDTAIGGYRVVRRLSSGGFGVVYLALDAEGQQVAIKEYLPSSLATRAPGELLPKVPPEKLSLYRLGLKSFPKTSGGKGLHVYVPLNTPSVTFADTKEFSRAIAML